jgi:hypothetical protein
MGRKSKKAISTRTRSAEQVEGDKCSQEYYEDPNNNSEPSQGDATKTIQKFRRIRQVRDHDIRGALTELLETEPDDDLEDDICRLSETLPA